MNKCWMIVASKNHVQNGIKEGIAQACHGKQGPLKRMNVNDGVIYYSPKLVFKEKTPCQQFTAIGKVSSENVYPFDMGNAFIPYRRDIKYFKANPCSIFPLIDLLSFIEDKKYWGYKFRFGFFEIAIKDYQAIAKAMQVSII